MTDMFDVIIVGAGPAGMSCATRLRQSGQHVLLIDEQPTPGGQIWRNVEAMAHTPLGTILGPDYTAGLDVVAAFRASGVEYWPQTEVWQIERGWKIHCRVPGGMRATAAPLLVLACGAYERVFPFLGWTLPGVLTVGGAQVLLKTSGQIPDSPVWILGSGPLQLLYAKQLLAANGRIAGILNTAPRINRLAALAHAPRALLGWRDLRKGLGWIRELRRAGVHVIDNVTRIELRGSSRVEEISYVRGQIAAVSAPASVVLVHDGLLPNLHAPVSVGAKTVWRGSGICFAPETDIHGRSSVDDLYIIGDAAGIGGAKAARLSGDICAEAIEARRRNAHAISARAIGRLVAHRSRVLATRPFLEALYRPGIDISSIKDDTIVCRCEEVTAGDIRAACAGASGTDSVKIRTRAGMGMCQGRQCGYVVSQLLAKQIGRQQFDLGFMSARPPLKPVSLGELAVSRSGSY